jgi:hypothetical protein
MEIIREFAKPRFKYFCTIIDLDFLTAIHKAMEWRVIELRTASIKSI